jgi:hypothetical protein
MVEETGHASVAWFRAANTVEFACWLCFVSTTSSYISSLGLHAAIQHGDLRLDPRTYRPIRSHDSGAMTPLALCQAGVPELRRVPDLLSVPQYATLAQKAAKIIATSNDVLSYPREQRATPTAGTTCSIQ